MSKSKNVDIDKLGRFISLILRHHPESIGISLDEFGYANVNELITKMNAHGKYIDFQTLKYIVDNNNKKRYSFNEDFSKIRANQGHSIKVNLELTPQIPPNELYHGTASRFLDNILKEGITKQTRQYVHLSKDVETAINVGKRHGKPIVLVIDATQMFQDGIQFYLSKNGVWLCDYIDPKYIKNILAS
ncbi:MAG: RNA 2'-phosphotransferase [Oscillospiraceae bacterium]